MIKIYNTLTANLEEFIPLIEKEVSMYVCGPTVYNYIHIGNARPVIIFDVVRRYFEYSGYKVKYVQNFTDIDDKIINRANEENSTVTEISEKYIKGYLDDMKSLNIKEEGMIRPKATDHIGDMINMIKTLAEKGYAYESEGDVYFEVEKDKKEYGKLSKQNIDDLQSGSRVETGDIKKNHLDFALWKKAKENEPFWESPWGKGRPGWHIECSAMSHKQFGKTFDIHGGGQDLIFPHHENEIAQSQCCFGGEFARYWMHNGYLNIDGEKMSKSGTFLLLRDILKSFEGRIIRFFMLSTHYRKPIDFSDFELNNSKTALERIENLLIRIDEIAKLPAKENGNGHNLAEKLAVTKEKVIESMNEDFNTVQAIGVIFELVRDLNKILDEDSLSEKGIKVALEIKEYILEFFQNVFGVELKIEKDIGDLSEKLLDLLLDIRQDIRLLKHWDLSDKIRDRLSELGINLKDGKDKTTWTR